MKFDQGTAPAVQFEGDEIIWEFKLRFLEVEDDKELKAKLIEAGAVCIDDPVVKPAEPEGYATLTKPEAVEKAKTELGVDISVSQSRADIMAKIAKAIEDAQGGNQ